MRGMFSALRRADPEAFTEVICTDWAQHAANGIAEVVGLRAEVETARANRPLGDEESTRPGQVFIPPEAKGEP